jgi:hypothetical protein
VQKHLQQFWAWLEEASKRAWVLILLVGVVSLGFVVANYRLQLNANRPELITAGPRINLNTHPESLVVYWGNIGRKPARRGIATLFTVSEDRKQKQKIATANITGAGSNVNPGSGGQAEFSVDMQKFLGTFLTCVEYFDDVGVAYRQAFLFRVGAEVVTGVKSLDELAPPDYQHCL